MTFALTMRCHGRPVRGKPAHRRVRKRERSLPDFSEGALQATIRVDMTATDRDAAIRITPPTP